jgi:protein-S-isoprenylcysteine O-methyltransferase Ste14
MTAGEKLYDALMRLPIVVLTLFFLVRETGALRQVVGSHPYFGGDWPFAANVAARVSVLMFLILLAVLHASRRRPVRKYETWQPKIVAVLGLSFTFLLLLLHRATPDALWDSISAILILIGDTLCILAVLDLGRSLSIMPEARALVTEGLYRRIRHPLYLAEEIAVLGIFLQFRSWQALAIVAVHFYFQIRRMGWEEGILASEFPGYTEYQRRSNRLVPGLY